ncbi:peroxiredoxin-like family protein [Actinoplanes sp. NPDC026623]|uniref:peroxiredoxin-like family protein n=1 Tax=Actinoplanes sp. NPDC026623 TaxID=3155610 RepID=UPI0033E6B0DB
MREVSARELTPVTGPPVPVPDPRHLVHLQFRRFAGCPVCNLHVRSLILRRAEIEAAGIREVLVFHSTAELLREHTADVPFPVIADPGKRLYAEFGVGASPRALLNPGAWLPILRAVLRSSAAVLRGRERSPSLNPQGGRTGLPADFLIAPDGSIVASKYGTHAYDQWSVDELLALSADAERGRARPGSSGTGSTPVLPT